MFIGFLNLKESLILDTFLHSGHFISMQPFVPFITSQTLAPQSGHLTITFAFKGISYNCVQTFLYATESSVSG